MFMFKMVTPEIYYSFISTILVLDIFIYMKIKDMDKKNHVKLARLGLIISVLYSGIVATIYTSLTLLIVWPPVILSLIILWYLSFIKYPQKT
jgi:hypothetical protein